LPHPRTKISEYLGPPTNISECLEALGIRVQESPAYILNDMVKTLYHRGVRTKYKNILAKNASLKNIYSEKDRCFIVGNGPSLAKQDLSPLANEHVIMANLFYQHKMFSKISPEYYCVIGPLFFVDPWFLKGFWHGLDNAFTKTPRTKLFLTLDQIGFLAKNHLLENVDVHYLLTSLDMSKYGIRKIDLAGPIPSGLNVTFLSMLISYYMGFRNIILIGCDSNYAALPGAKSMHFYTEDSECPSPSYASGVHTYEWLLRENLDLFKRYRIVGNFLASKGCKIFNATHGGFLDIFPRVEYERLFK
jgi:hypothetical protein